jgi:hypothetical protein
LTGRAENRLRLYVAVTAHRDLVDAELPAIESRVEACFNELSSSFPDLPLTLLTPLAKGGDQLVARVAHRMGLPFKAVLPMKLAEYEQDFHEGDALGAFRSLVDLAEEVVCLPAVQQVTGAGNPADTRDLQYAQLGVFLSNHCQVLLALWDGKTGSKLGGTGQVVQYHLTAVMPGFIADSSPASLLADNENDLVYHVVCSRDRPGGSPAGGLQAVDGAWFSSRDDGARTAALPGVYRTLLGRLQRFAQDWRDKQAAIDGSSVSLLRGAPDLRKPSGSALTDRLFRVADGLALHYQKRVHNSLRAIHVLAVLMGLEFIAYAEFDGPSYMILLFLVLFFAGVILYFIGERREWHRKYLDYRALAEGLRVQFYWNLAGVVDVNSAEFAYDNFLQQQDADLGWIRHVMRHASLYRVRGEVPDDRWVQWVIDEWVGNTQAARGQVAYYAAKEHENEARYRRISRLGALSLWTGIAVAALLYLISWRPEDEARHLLLVLMGALPLMAGVWDAYSHKRAEKELIKQYAFMGRVFRKARKLLDDSDDIAFQRHILRALGQAALDEGAEWLLMHRERPLEHGKL